MKSSAKKVELASVDDLFTTEESRADAGREKVVEISLSELHPFKGHPFKVKDDDAMMETADSIRQYGVLVPAIARPDPSGGYELVAGHRRHRASELEDGGDPRHSYVLVVDKVNPGLTDLFLKQARKVLQPPEKGSVLEKLKQEPPERKPVTPKKREPER